MTFSTIKTTKFANFHAHNITDVEIVMFENEPRILLVMEIKEIVEAQSNKPLSRMMLKNALRDDRPYALGFNYRKVSQEEVFHPFVLNNITSNGFNQRTYLNRLSDKMKEHFGFGLNGINSGNTDYFRSKLKNVFDNYQLVCEWTMWQVKAWKAIGPNGKSMDIMPRMQ